MLNELRRLGHYAVNNGPGSAAGTPDVFACIRGRFVAMELKKSGGRVSKIQRYRLDQIAGSGGVAAIVASRDDFRDLLRELDEDLIG